MKISGKVASIVNFIGVNLLPHPTHHTVCSSSPRRVPAFPFATKDVPCSSGLSFYESSEADTF